MKILKLLTFLSIVGSGFAGSSSICVKPSDFLAFEEIWLESFARIKENLVQQSSTYPVLSKAFSLTIKCEINQGIGIAIDAVSRLTGVDSSIVRSLINGTGSSQNSEFDCIAEDMIYMRDHILAFKDIIDVPQDSFTDSFSSCSDTYEKTVSYASSLISVLYDRQQIYTQDVEAYSKVNMSDLYFKSLALLEPCINEIILAGIGSILNVDPSPLLDYLEDKIFFPPHPFDCIKSIIDIIKNVIYETKNNYFDSNYQDFVFPSINFFG